MRIPSFHQARVLVVGDLMLDRYWLGDTRRISPEAPVPIVHVQQLEERPGGAANVALNITSLGAKATLLGMTGNDKEADTLEKKLHEAQIDVWLKRFSHLPTITKLRVISHQQQLIRLDFEQAFPPVEMNWLLESYAKILKDINLVVLSDYGKGTLREAQALIRMAKEQNIPVLVDPKGNDFSRYKGATLLTPNQKEFEAIVGPCDTDEMIYQKGLQLIDDYQLQAVLITRGEHGMSLVRRDMPLFHLPAQAREVYDVTGAGDTVIGVLATALACEEDIVNAMQLANLAAGIVVGHLGTASVSLDELKKAIFMMHAQECNTGILTEMQALVEIERARQRGERIVVTNGCFDILHRGHVSYLNEAKSLGDRLVVLVNDDESIRRLKGVSRPINNLMDRMSVLSGLRAVDWVVPFSEDTPHRLITRIQPDILVKGEDYQVHEIAGAKEVMEYGGLVKLLPFVEGCSTSAIINRIRDENI